MYTSCEWQFLNHPKYEIVDPQKVWSWGKGYGSMGQVLTQWCLCQCWWLWLDLPSWGLEADMSLVGCHSKIWRIIRIIKKKYKVHASATYGCMCSLFCGVISIVAQLVLNAQTTRSWNQANSATSGSAETCPTEGQGHLAHGTPSGVPARACVGWVCSARYKLLSYLNNS